MAIFAVATNVNADVIAFDNFDYPDGPLVGNGGWVNHSGGPDDLLVSGGQVVVQHGIPSEDANLPFTGTSGNIFYGINFSVDDPGAADYRHRQRVFCSLPDTGFDFSARLDVVPANVGGDYTVGIASDDQPPMHLGDRSNLRNDLPRRG